MFNLFIFIFIFFVKLGKMPFISWQYSWKFICPISLIAIVILDAIFFAPLKFGSYYFPKWSIGLGYFLNFVSLIPIPLYAFIYFFFPNLITEPKRN
jgi:hypothetical protein